VEASPFAAKFIKNQLGLLRVMGYGLVGVSYLTIGDVLSDSAHD
jgi:hypothetical protein